MRTPTAALRWIALLTALCAAIAAPAQEPSLSDRVAAIERSSISEPPHDSARLINALLAEHPELPPELAYRIDLVRARNLALAGDYAAAIDLGKSMLERAPSAPLRTRALTLLINCATNAADYPQTFGYLRQALDSTTDDSPGAAAVFGLASYLYRHVGEDGQAVDFSSRALAIARAAGDARDECMALSNLANALNVIGHAAPTEDMRHQQVAACTRANDPVFTADALKGIGQALMLRHSPKEAMSWLRQARAKFVEAGFTTGILETDITLAEAELAAGAATQDAAARVRDALPIFESQHAWDNVELAHRVLSQVAEAAGQTTEALRHLQQANLARKRLDDDAHQRRLAYLQMEFDTAAKARRISALESDRQRQQAQLEAHARTQSLQALALLGVLTLVMILLVVLWRTVMQRKRYRHAAETDGLTGLYNHQSTLARGQALLLHCRRGGLPFTAIVADIDHFKRINDQFGHAAGDAVLRALGTLLSAAFPQPHVIGRSGGEEFTILLDVDTATARALIERLRARITPLTVLDQPVEYSLSFGLSAARDANASLEDTLRAADLALYRAKRGGRNQVVDASSGPAAQRTGAGLVVVGTGIQLGRHLSARCLSEIQEAECVFALTDGATRAMLVELRPDLIDLCRYYAPGKDRRQTYREMVAAIMPSVVAGKRVCAVFYGHPGVFADVPHAIIAKTRAAGIPARMEPGISAEACLYADLGIDPGRHGVQSLEATQFLQERRRIDPRSLLVLWQVALVGDVSCTRFHAEPAELQALVTRLLEDYPADHEVILYEAARLPVEQFRAERLPLKDLPGARYEEFTTLVVPPLCAAPQANGSAAVDEVDSGTPA